MKPTRLGAVSFPDLFLPSSGLMIGDIRLIAKRDPNNNIDFYLAGEDGREVNLTGEALMARATANLTLTTTAQSIVGDGDSTKVRLLLPTIGEWLVTAVVDFAVGTVDPDTLYAYLYVNDGGSPETGPATFHPTGGAGHVSRATVAAQWKITTTAANTPIELKAKKTTDAGVAVAFGGPTTLSATIGAGGGSTVETVDHGTLDGLGDDDHNIYLLTAGTRAGSTGAAQDFGSTGIKADVIAESTGGAGITIDAKTLVKDGYLDLTAISDPGAPAASTVRVFANGEHIIALDENDLWHDMSMGGKFASVSIHIEPTVSDANGLNITWGAGEIHDTAKTGQSQMVTIAAQPANQACTASSLNWLFFDQSAGGLVLTATESDVNYGLGDIPVAHILTSHNDILDIHQFPVSNKYVHNIHHGLSHAIEKAVFSGMVVSEHPAANAFDVDQSAGAFVHGGFMITDVAKIESTATNIIRWSHDAGDAWTSDVNSQIDAANWDDDDDGLVVKGNNAARYYRSVFACDGTNIHWVYPQVEYTTIAQALTAPNPTLPPLLQHLPLTTALVMKGNDAALPTAGGDQWIDVRPLIGAVGTGGTITSHLNLADISTGDHHAQAHGPSDHTEGTGWRMVYQDTNGDDTEFGFSDDGKVLTSAGAAAAPTFEAADGHAHISQASITTVGALDSGSITSNFGTINTGASAITTTGALGAGETTLADGASLNLQEAITFTGATGENIIEFPDHLADALSFEEGGTAYLTFVTTNGSESIALGKATAITGALTATSYGGITEANLVDKSATEAITGEWTFPSGLKFGAASDVHLYRGAADNLYLGAGDSFTISATGELATDVITETTPGTGVTIDSVLLKDGKVDGVDVAARDHAQAHGISDHTGHANWKALYTDASGDEQEIALGVDGTVFTSTGAAGVPAFEAPAGGGGQDLATDTLWAAAGDLVKGTGDDAADILSIGAAHSILQTLDGAAITWQTAPELQYIKATDGVTRMTTTPDAFFGGTRFDGNVSINSAMTWASTLYVVMAGAQPVFAANTNGINIVASAFTIQNSDNTTTIFRGAPVVLYVTDAATGLILDGMNFKPTVSLDALVSASFTRVTGISAAPTISATLGETITIALYAGLYLPDPTIFGGSGTAAVTDSVGVYIGNYGDASATNTYGIKIFDQTGGGTASYGIYIEDADTYALWVDAGLSRFDGDGTDVFELPADATANGAAQVGRIPVKIGGGTQYLYYYGS